MIPFFSVLLTFGRKGSGTCCAVKSENGFASSFTLILYASPMPPNPSKIDENFSAVYIQKQLWHPVLLLNIAEYLLECKFIFN